MLRTVSSWRAEVAFSIFVRHLCTCLAQAGCYLQHLISVCLESWKLTALSPTNGPGELVRRFQPDCTAAAPTPLTEEKFSFILECGLLSSRGGGSFGRDGHGVGEGERGVSTAGQISIINPGDQWNDICPHLDFGHIPVNFQ